MAPRSTRRSPLFSLAWLVERAPSAALVLVLGGAMLAMGAIYPRAAAIAAAFVALPLALAPRLVTDRGRPPAVVLVFAALALVTILQSLPLPLGVVRILSPVNADVWARAVPGGAAPSYAPLSLAPELSWVEAAKWSAYAAIAWVGATWSRREGARGAALVAMGLALVAGAVTVAHGLLEAKAVFGIYHPQLEYPRWRVGPFLNSNHLSAYLSLGFFGAIAALIARGDRPQVVLGALVVAAGALVTGVMLLGSRAAFPLLLVGGVGVAFVGGRARGDDPRVESRHRVALVVGGVLCGGTALGMYGFWREIRAALGDREATKLGAIADAFGLARAHWTVGVGRGAFEGPFFAFKTVHHNEYWPQPENLLAQWASEWGAPVAICALLAFSLVAVRALRGIARSSSARVLAVALVVLVLHNQLDSSLELFSVGALAAFLAGAVFGGSRTPSTLTPPYVGLGAAVAVAGIALVALWHRPESLNDVRTRALSKVTTGADVAEVVSEVRRFPADPWLALAAAAVSGRSRPLSGLAWYSRALERGPNLAATHISLASELAAVGRRSQALLELRIAAESDDDAAPQAAHLAIAIARTAEEALGAAPLSRPWGLSSVTEMARSDRPFAIELRAYVLARLPCEPELRRQALAEALAGWTPGHEAVVEAEIAEMDRCPAGKYAASLARASLAWTLGKREEGVALLERACAAPDAATECVILLAERAAAVRDDARVRSAIRLAVSRGCGSDAGCGTAWSWASGVYQVLGDEASAQAAAIKATEADPGNVDLWRALAVTSQRAGMRERAVRAAQRVLLRLPGDAAARAILDASGVASKPPPTRQP